MPATPHVISLRPSTLTLCLVLAVGLAAADSQAATKKRKPAAAAKPATPAVTACGDFYGFANTDWVKSHPVPASGSVSALGELAQRAQQQQRELLEAAVTSAKTPAQKFLGDFWASGMDESAVDRDGSAAILPLLAKIDAIKKNKDVAGVIAALHQAGIPVAFGFGADESTKAPGTGIGLFREGGMGLPDPAFYTRTDADARAVLGRYNGYVQKMLMLSGTPQARVGTDAQQVIDLETRIARVLKPNAAAQAQTAVATKELPKRFRNLGLDGFLKAQGVAANEVAFTDTALFGQLDKLVGGQKPAQWQAYLRYQVASTMAPYLGKAWREAEHEFRGKLLRGEDTPPARWQQVLAGIDAAAGEMMASQYQAVFFPEATRTRASTLSQQVKSALLSAIDRNTWMDAAGKAAARARVEPLQIELGGPSRTYDFNLPASSRNSFATNALIAAAWNHREQMKRIGQSDIGRAWDAMPQTPALYYDAAQNRLFATAAALQPPVLDMSQNLASQYGSFGAMIGHEMTHAIDGSGTENAAWTTLTAPLAAHFGSFGYPHTPTVKVDGARTRSENAADLSGLELAFMAYQAAEPQANAAAQQNFFRGWSRVWTQQLASGTAAAHAATSMQPPGMWRSNGSLMLMPAFAKAYTCKAGSMMIAPAAHQLTLWK